MTLHARLELSPELEPVAHHAKLLLDLRTWLYGKDYFLALDALEFASRYHRGLRKDGKTPEFFHQVFIVNYIRTPSSCQ